MTADEAVRVAQADMAEAQRRIHWHLSRAANACIMELRLDKRFDEEMAAVAEWKKRYDAALRTYLHWMVA